MSVIEIYKILLFIRMQDQQSGRAEYFVNIPEHFVNNPKYFVNIPEHFLDHASATKYVCEILEIDTVEDSADS